MIKWTEDMRNVIKENYPQKTYKEIASILSVSVKSVERQIVNLGLAGAASKVKSENKQTYKTIGSRRRANNKYNGIISRLNRIDRSKNKHYKGIRFKTSREDFIKWFMPLDFEGSSIDRINKDKDYEIGNIQVISISDNIRKDKVKSKNGMCVCYICNKRKPLSAFCKDKRRINGHSTICIECERQRGRNKYKKKQIIWKHR